MVFWRAAINQIKAQEEQSLRERAFFAAASRQLQSGAEGVSLEYYEGNVNAAAEAMGIDLDAEVAALKARPEQLDM